MKAQLTKSTLFILTVTFFIFGLLPVSSNAGVSIGYHHGGHHGGGYHIGGHHGYAGGGHHGHLGQYHGGYGHHEHHGGHYGGGYHIGGHYGGGHHSHLGHYYGGYGHHDYGHHGYYGGYGYGSGYGYGAYSYYPHHYYSYPGYYSPYESYQYYARPNYPRANYDSHDSGNNRQYTGSKYTGTDSEAWAILSQGHANHALNIFASLAENNPKAGIPKVGYALAAASSGDLSRGVWAMRRAFRIDPDSLHYLQLDEANQGVIDALIDKYHYSVNQEDKFSDEAFMVSALNYLKHDYVASRGAVDHAINNGDKSASVYNLQRLINQQLVHDKKL